MLQVKTGLYILSQFEFSKVRKYKWKDMRCPRLGMGGGNLDVEFLEVSIDHTILNIEMFMSCWYLLSRNFNEDFLSVTGPVKWPMMGIPLNNHQLMWGWLDSL